jgi:ferredoxin-nitrite reductase
VKARLKFMVDDLGPEGMRERVEALLGRQLDDYVAPGLPHPVDHVGVHPQKQPGLSYVGVPVHLGLTNAEQLLAVAALAESLGGDVRLTRQQNFVLANVPDGRLADALAELERIGFGLGVNRLRAAGIACTGEPHCNFSVTETKARLGRLIEHLEERFGDTVADVGLQLDGCPHACAQHWIADLGFQGTTARDAEGKRRQAYDIFVRGGLGPDAAIGRPLFRRVPSEELDAAVDGLLSGWLEGRREGERFPAFARRLTDDELGELAGLEPARAREREEVAA